MAPVILPPSLYDTAVSAGCDTRGYVRAQLIPTMPDEQELDPEDDEDILDPADEPDDSEEDGDF